MGAVEAAERIRAGALTSVELTSACLDRVEQTDSEMRGWEQVERDVALGQARAMDSLRQRGLPLGALHGVPIAIDERFGAKSVPIDQVPERSEAAPGGVTAAVVERLKEAGAVVFGRTRASGRLRAAPAAATNPCNAKRSAGDPCGSAAVAVGAYQVPLAIVCESSGGVVLSASYCGVFGFRPTRGIISRRGVRSGSPTLDQVGGLGRNLEDLALLADVLGGYDAADEASELRPRPQMREGFRSKPPVEPDFIWLDMPYDERLSAAGHEGFEELRDALGPRVVRLPAPAWFGRLPAAHRIIEEYESAIRCRAHDEQTSLPSREIARRRLAHGEERYRAAVSAMRQTQEYFSTFFHAYDAVVAPAAGGESPSIDSGPEDPVFCRIWALCGLPSLCVPLLTGEEGLPVGAQLVGSARGDDRLLRSAAWLMERLHDETHGPEAMT